MGQQKIPLGIPNNHFKVAQEILSKKEPIAFDKIKHTKIIYTFDKKGHRLEYVNYNYNNYQVSRTVYDKEKIKWTLLMTTDCNSGDCF